MNVMSVMSTPNKETSWVSIDSIVVGERLRKDLGDLQPLAKQMDAGLTPPIGITASNELVYGYRRLHAAKHVLGWTKIPAAIVPVDDLVEGQLGENLVRKEYSITERLSIAKILRSRIGGRKGDRTDLKPRENLPEVVGRTSDHVATVLGFGNRKTLEQAEKVVESGTDETIQAMEAGTLSIYAASELAKAKPEHQRRFLLETPDQPKRRTANAVRKATKRMTTVDARRAIADSAPESSPKDFQFFCCRFQELSTKVELKPGSVDLILTDPPWGKDFLDQMAELGEFAAQFLRPGGLFVAYFGDQHLPAAINALGKCLEFGRLGFSTWNGTGVIGHQHNVLITTMPVLIYSNGKFPKLRCWFNTFLHATKEKVNHDWQRPLEDVMHWLQAFSKPGDLVLDPCSGSFTTAVACKTLSKRRFIGCDPSEDNVKIGRSRLADAPQSIMPLEAG